MSILDRLPDASTTVNASLRLETDLEELVNVFGSLDAGGNESPLGQLFALFGELNTRLDIDAQPLAGGLTDAVTSIQNALPANEW